MLNQEGNSLFGCKKMEAVALELQQRCSKSTERKLILEEELEVKDKIDFYQ